MCSNPNWFPPYQTFISLIQTNLCRLCSLNQIATGWMVRVVMFDLLLKCCLLNPAVCRFTPLSTFYFPPNWAKFSGMRFFRGIIFFRLNQIPPHLTMSPPGGGGGTFPKKFFASKSFPKMHFFYSFFSCWRCCSASKYVAGCWGEFLRIIMLFRHRGGKLLSKRKRVRIKVYHKSVKCKRSFGGGKWSAREWSSSLRPWFHHQEWDYSYRKLLKAGKRNFNHFPVQESENVESVVGFYLTYSICDASTCLKKYKLWIKSNHKIWLKIIKLF